MATTYHKLSGKAIWAKVHKPDTKFEPQWSIGLVLNDDERVKFKSLKKEFGLRMSFKDVPESDEEYVTFRRKVNKPTWTNEPPVVEDEEGNHISDLIGNGSAVTVEFEIYTGKYKEQPYAAAQFNKVIVHDLVRYEKPATQEPTPASTDSGDSLPPVKTPRKF